VSPLHTTGDTKTDLRILKFKKNPYCSRNWLTRYMILIIPKWNSDNKIIDKMGQCIVIRWCRNCWTAQLAFANIILWKDGSVH